MSDWPEIAVIRNRTKAYTNETDVQNETDLLENGIRARVLEGVNNSAKQGLDFFVLSPKFFPAVSTKIATIRIMKNICDELEPLGYIATLTPRQDGYCDLTVVWDETLDTFTQFEILPDDDVSD